MLDVTLFHNKNDKPMPPCLLDILCSARNVCLDQGCWCRRDGRL